MSGDRWIGDNPLVHIRPPTCILSSPTFYHRYGYGNMLIATAYYTEKIKNGKRDTWHAIGNN